MAAVLVTAFWLWTICFLLLKFLEFASDGILSATLKRQNINLYFCFISFYTTRFNDSIESLARRHRRPLNYWFSIGVCVGLIGLLASVLVLSSNIFLTILNSPQHYSPSHSLALPTHSQTHNPHDRPRGRRIPPPARIPFLHGAPRPWWLPRSYWRLLVPRDHDAIHSALHRQARISHREPNAPVFPHFGPKGGPHRGNCHGRRKRMEEFVQWNANINGIPPPALSQPSASLTLSDPHQMTEQQIEHDLNEKGDQSEVTFSWRRKPKSFQVHPAESQDNDPPFNHSQTANSTSFRSHTHETGASPRTTPILTPLVPGVTIPAGDIWYMIAAVLISAVLHELGHALAAGMQNAKVSGVGGFLALAFPGAYVQLHGIEELTPFAQLKVYCAGAWHNVVVAIMALFVVGALPIIVSVVYVFESGAMVVSIPDVSPLMGHLEPGDIILSMGQFPIRDGGPSFRNSVHNITASNDSVGFCVSEDMYWNFSRPKENCCDQSVLQSLKYDEQSDYKCFRVQGVEKRRVCMDPFTISSQETCRTSVECMGGEHETGHVSFSREAGTSRMDDDKKRKAREEQRCFIPILTRGQQLVDIQVRSAYTGGTMHFFYEGYPQVLSQSVTVSSYVPRLWSVMPFQVLQVLASLDLPNMFERLLQYLSSISFALALLNMAPVFYLDGEAASALYMRLFAPKVSHSTMSLVRNCILISGSGLLIVNLLMAFLDLGYP